MAVQANPIQALRQSSIFLVQNDEITKLKDAHLFIPEKFFVAAQNLDFFAKKYTFGG